MHESNRERWQWSNRGRQNRKQIKLIKKRKAYDNHEKENGIAK